MGARKTDTLDPGHFVHRLEQARKIAAGVVRSQVVVHDLPEQLYFLAARRRQFRDLAKDFGLCAHPLVTARVRHHAVGAEVVAAFHDGDETLDRVISARQAEGKRGFVVGCRDVHQRRPRAGSLLDQHRQHLETLSANDHVHELRFREDPCAFLLGHAAGHGHHRCASRADLESLEIAKPAVELLLGSLADRARVDYDEVGVLVGIRHLEASLLEQPGHPLRVVYVHLAAVGFDQVLSGHYRRTFAFACGGFSPFAFASTPTFAFAC